MDPRWWGRALVALLVVAFLALMARAAVLSFQSDSARLTGADRAVDAATARPAPAPR